ncbi:hypothetical protein ABVT39_023493, partial [Epinephelus coioides]
MSGSVSYTLHDFTLTENSGPGLQTRARPRSSFIFSLKQRWPSVTRGVAQTVEQTSTGV